MLRAIPKSWYSQDYVILENDTKIASVDFAMWREAAELTTRDASFRMFREGLINGSFVLKAGVSTVALAEKPSAFSRLFRVTHAGKQYTLEAGAVFGRKFVVSNGQNQIGSIFPEHCLSRKAVVDLPEDIPLAVRIFMFWLVMVLWKRASVAAASSQSVTLTG